MFWTPDLLGHPDNLMPANPYATPQHIVPEWYFLWVYAILRSIPNKAMGVVAISLVFASLVALPFLGKVSRIVVQNGAHEADRGIQRFRNLAEWLSWTFIAELALLTWVSA